MLLSSVKEKYVFIPWGRRLEDRPYFGLLREGKRWEMTWLEGQERFEALGDLLI